MISCDMLGRFSVCLLLSVYSLLIGKLLYERIQALEDVEIRFNGDTVSFSCTAVTLYGDFELRKEGIAGV